MGWRQVALGRDMGENQHPPICPVTNVEYRHSVPLFNVIYLQGQGAIVINKYIDRPDMGRDGLYWAATGWKLGRRGRGRQ